MPDGRLVVVGRVGFGPVVVDVADEVVVDGRALVEVVLEGLVAPGTLAVDELEPPPLAPPAGAAVVPLVPAPVDADDEAVVGVTADPPSAVTCRIDDGLA